MGSVRLTKTIIERLKPNPYKPLVVYDSETPGLHVKVSPKGKKALVLWYRSKSRRTATITLGHFPIMTLAQARETARKLLLEVANGGDPARERAKAKAAPTISNLCDRYLVEHVAVFNKPSTMREVYRLVKKRIRPAFGKISVTELSRADVKRWHFEMRGTPYEGNRALAALSKMMSLAWTDWEICADNPCRGIKRHAEKKRERFLSEAEFARLGDVLADAERTGGEAPGPLAAIRLLILTGCRLSEVITLRWEHVDMEHGCLRLPDSKTGSKVVHLGAPALKVLATNQRQGDSPWVIVGRKPDTRLTNLHGPWNRLKAKAGLPDVRIHDLRHSFASVGAATGMSLLLIGKMLGHTQAATTQRYAHLGSDPVKQAVETVTDKIAAAMSGHKGEVVSLRREDG